MSFSRTAYHALSALFAASLFGCANGDAFTDEDGSGMAGGVDETEADLGSTAAAEDIAARDIGEPGLLPDINGDFLIASSVSGRNIRLRATVDFTPNGDAGTADISAQPLTAPGCGTDGAPVGNPLVATDVAIDAGGNFSLDFSGTLPGAANPILCLALSGGISVSGRVVNADLLCGDVTAPISNPFGAVRITGGNLPTPVTACP